MRIIVADDYEEMSKMAAQSFLAHYYNCSRPNNMAITGGKTPKRMYEILVPMIRELPNTGTEFFLFDEIPVKGKEPGVTLSAMKDMFFDHIPAHRIHSLNKDNYGNYDEKNNKKGGISFIMMGLGPDGHFCGNLTETLNSFDEGVHAVKSDTNERIRNRLAYLSGGEEYREECYYTYGPKTVMEIPEILFIVSGAEKAEILKKVIEGPVDTQVPATVFMQCPCF